MALYRGPGIRDRVGISPSQRFCGGAKMVLSRVVAGTWFHNVSGRQTGHIPLLHKGFTASIQVTY
jgi:hypothetical protein